MHLDAVRVGTAFLGRLLVENKYGLKKIGQFKTNVVEIKELDKGYNVSYNNKYKTKAKTKVAIIPVGYFDGFNVKKLPDSFLFVDKIIAFLISFKDIFRDNRLKVKINGKKYYVIGRTGMYHSIIDITDGNVNIGDEVEIDSISPLYIRTELRRKYC